MRLGRELRRLLDIFGTSFFHYSRRDDATPPNMESRAHRCTFLAARVRLHRELESLIGFFSIAPQPFVLLRPRPNWDRALAVARIRLGRNLRGQILSSFQAITSFVSTPPLPKPESHTPVHDPRISNRWFRPALLYTLQFTSYLPRDYPFLMSGSAASPSRRSCVPLR
jgi:hypothetical protein